MRPRVVFVSGWAHPARTLDGLAKSLGAPSRAVVLEADPEGVLRELERAAVGEAVVLAGWSLGGMLALEAAVRRPDLIRGLVLVAATPRFSRAPDFPHGVEEARLRALRASLRRDRSAALARFYEECAAPNEPVGDLRGDPPVRTPSAAILETGLDYLGRADLRAACATVALPCRTLHGSEDRIVPVEAGRWLAARIPGVRYREVPGSGHDIPLRHPEIVAEEIAALSEAPPPSDGSDARDVAARFSRAARTYEARAAIQAEAADRLVALLEGIEEPERILEVGCGTGILTARLLARFPRAEVDALDVSDGMLAEARRKLGAEPRLRLLRADARAYRAPRPYSLVASSASLHWLAPLGDSVAHLAGLLQPGGRMAGAVMVEGTLRELHEIRRRVVPEKAPPGRLPSDAELRSALRGAGLAVEVFEAESFAIACPSAGSLLETLRSQGLTGGAVSRAAVPLGRGELRRLVEEYEAAYRAEGGVRATYRIARFRARRR